METCADLPGTAGHAFSAFFPHPSLLIPDSDLRLDPASHRRGERTGGGSQSSGIQLFCLAS